MPQIRQLAFSHGPGTGQEPYRQTNLLYARQAATPEHPATTSRAALPAPTMGSQPPTPSHLVATGIHACVGCVGQQG